ncbi:uncharacterized protein LOC120090114 [Benincasa hispida]|uniref:uncharacterized protein LOC120090114 n=1 Tax=Benincasa hispida TaxID=102211 RepID=UPI0019027A5D|nr:uncharacterized protein LOC120090114 [Benincasa hispida]
MDKNYSNWAQALATAWCFMMLLGLLCCCLSTNPRHHDDSSAANSSCTCDGGYAGALLFPLPLSFIGILLFCEVEGLDFVSEDDPFWNFLEETLSKKFHDETDLTLFIYDNIVCLCHSDVTHLLVYRNMQQKKIESLSILIP